MGIGNRIVILAFCLAVLRLSVVADEPLPAFATSLRLRGLTNEVIRLRVGRIEQAFAKRGFFRLGILPTVRLQQVDVSFETGRGLAHLEEAFSKAKAIGIGNHVELAQTTIECVDAPFFRVEAASINKLTGNHISFRGPVTVVTSGATNRFARAEMRCDGGKWLVSGLPSSADSGVIKSVLLQ